MDKLLLTRPMTVYPLQVAAEDTTFTIMKELTFGQKSVGITFNPGGLEAVNKCKAQYAAIIDDLNALREATTDPGQIRHLSVAITDAETAQMRAVKAITWKS